MLRCCGPRGCGTGRGAPPLLDAAVVIEGEWIERIVPWDRYTPPSGRRCEP